MSYLDNLTAPEKSDLEFYLEQERDSAAVEGFQLDENAFKEAWAKVVVRRRKLKEAAVPAIPVACVAEPTPVTEARKPVAEAPAQPVRTKRIDVGAEVGAGHH